MERQLASIQRIIELIPIPDANKIEIAVVKGWKCVVKKGEFKVNDLVVYVEIDSLLPYTEWSSFLWKNKEVKNDTSSKFRLRTIKLRGQISQGLILPLSVLEPYGDVVERFDELFEGDDVTESLDITKYEPYIPAQLQGLIKSNFPSWLSKTDETRIQSCPSVVQRHCGESFYITEKLDGSSMTVYIDKEGEFGVCSRNLDLKETEGNAFWKVARELDLETKLKKGNVTPIALQGELIGPGIQKNKYKLDKLEFRVFNVFQEDKYLNKAEMEYFCESINIHTVPILDDSYILLDSLDELVKMSIGKSVLYDTDREGIVLRPLKEERDEDLGRLSFKVINPEFLIKNEE